MHHPPPIPSRPAATTRPSLIDSLPLPQVLTLRREKANLLGYDSYADISMASKVSEAVLQRGARAN